MAARQSLYKPFKKHIIEELKYRRDLPATQTSYIPSLRVTSLIDGDITIDGTVIDIKRGFSIGPTDISVLSAIEQITNLSGTGVNVGTHYPGGVPQPVFLPTTKRNLPAPGVESVEISTQSKGGFIFKALVNIKFYGIEQYNFLYQTFFRPGTPILIEYGHTRNVSQTYNNEPSRELTSLYSDDNKGFFRILSDDRKQLYSKLAYQGGAPITNRNTGAVVGLVSNFEVNLNENNEYQATVELINSLEFLYSLRNENTIVTLGNQIERQKSIFSKSVHFNFGYRSFTSDGVDYNRNRDIIWSIIKERQQQENENGLPLSVFSFITNRYTPEQTKKFQTNVVAPGTSPITTEVKVSDKLILASETPDDTFISLQYFLTDLINDILNLSLPDYMPEGYIAATDEEDEPFSIANVNEVRRLSRTTRNRIRISSMSYNTYWSDLRSVDNNVVFNNKNLYTFDNQDGTPKERWFSEFYWIKRREAYERNFGLKSVADIHSLFSIDSYLDNKLEEYGESRGPAIDVRDGRELKTFRGVYVRYDIIKAAFLESDTFMEAVNRILYVVNRSSGGILNLTARMVEPRNDEDTGNNLVSPEVNNFELVIFDANRPPKRQEVPQGYYTFFENNISEALDYDLQFNLPAAVASMIVATTNRDKVAVGGNWKEKLFTDYGYSSNLSNWISPPSGSISYISDQPAIKVPEVKTRQQFEDLRDEFVGDAAYQTFLGYKELVPSEMISKAIGNGLMASLPSAAKVNLRINGLDGFEFGNIFRVRNILPEIYVNNGFFMLLGYRHVIDGSGWITELEGQYIAENPNPEAYVNEPTGPILPPVRTFERSTPPNDGLADPFGITSGVDPLLIKIVEDTRRRLLLENPKIWLQIWSGRRSEDVNTKEGGAPKSKHLVGLAVDLNIYVQRPDGTWEYISKSDAVGGNQRAKDFHEQINSALQQTARSELLGNRYYSTELIWGGKDFRTLYDPNHWALKEKTQDNGVAR